MSTASLRPPWGPEAGRSPEEETGAAPRSHRVDVQLRHLDADASSGGLKDMFVLSGIAAHIGGGACKRMR